LYIRELKNKKQLTEQEIRMKTGFTIQTIRKYVKMAESDIAADKIILRERQHHSTTQAKQKRRVRIIFKWTRTRKRCLQACSNQFIQ